MIMSAEPIVVSTVGNRSIFPIHSSTSACSSTGAPAGSETRHKFQKLAESGLSNV